jgi:multidrug efflux pump subunit AcrB
MKDARLRAGLGAAGRALRWRAQTYEQAWLFATFAAVMALVVVVIAAAFDNWPQPWPIVAFITSAGTFAGQGLGSSYDVYRRQR